MVSPCTCINIPCALYVSSKYNAHRSNPDKIILKTIYYQRTSFQQLWHSFAYSAPRFWNDLPLYIDILTP